MPARRRHLAGRSAGRGCRPPGWSARGVAAATRGGGDGRECAVGARAGAAAVGRARGRAACTGGDHAALPRLGRPRAHRLRLLPRELEPAQGNASRRRVIASFAAAAELDVFLPPSLNSQVEVDLLMRLFERVIQDSVAEFLRCAFPLPINGLTLWSLPLWH
jgi:hypothetical protein